MKKVFFSFLMIFLSLNLVFGQSVSENEAKNIAKNFLVSSSSASLVMQKAPTKINDLNLVYEKVDKEQVTDKLFYVYNIKGDNGFVIVSADKRTKSILGYSHTGKFDKNKIPSNLSYWLDNYANEIVYAKKHLKEVSDKEFTTSPMARVAQKTTEVSPLLETINFNQDAPYNDQCPEKNGERTVTGCVATAMAQVMKFHEWPNQGKGSHSYLWNGQTLSVDFSAQTYDWTKIRPFYDGSETNEEKAEVAKLKYHIGVSVEMKYDLASNGGSGASTRDAAQSLYEYFDYDAGIQPYYREYYSYVQWVDKLKTELDNGRPVVYSGRSSKSGHAFVCDGYDTEERFHMNWGWGGYSNGYFELNALNPSGLGIGGGNGGYNFNHMIIAGIQKPIAGSQRPKVIGIDGFSNIPNEKGRTEYFDLTVNKLINLGSVNYSDAVYLTLMQNSTLVRELQTLFISNLPVGYFYSTFNFNSINIPSSVANGNYQIVVRYKNEQNNIIKSPAKQTGIKLVDVQITDTKLIFSSSVSEPNLQLVESPTVVTNLYHNKTGHIKLKLSNLGEGDYNAQLGMRLVKKDDNSVTQQFYHNYLGLPAGTNEKEISAIVKKITVPAGDYYLEVYYDGQNDVENKNFPTDLLLPNQYNRIDVTVLAEPTENFNLSATNLSMPSTVTIGSSFEFTADITNSGGFYNDEIKAYIFPASGGSSVGSFGKQTLFIDKNQTVGVTLVKDNIALEKGNYKVRLYHKNSGWKPLGSYQYFELIEKSSTDVNDTQHKNIVIAINPNAIWVTSSYLIGAIKLYDIAGKLVISKENIANYSVALPKAKLNKGVFLLQIVDKQNNIYINKIVVK